MYSQWAERRNGCKTKISMVRGVSLSWLSKILAETGLSRPGERPSWEESSQEPDESLIQKPVQDLWASPLSPKGSIHPLIKYFCWVLGYNGEVRQTWSCSYEATWFGGKVDTNWEVHGAVSAMMGKHQHTRRDTWPWCWERFWGEWYFRWYDIFSKAWKISRNWQGNEERE